LKPDNFPVSSVSRATALRPGQALVDRLQNSGVHFLFIVQGNFENNHGLNQERERTTRRAAKRKRRLKRYAADKDRC